jgi:hypothetical protein
MEADLPHVPTMGFLSVVTVGNFVYSWFAAPQFFIPCFAGSQPSTRLPVPSQSFRPVARSEL